MEITHVLSDGTVKHDITGYMVKPEKAEEFYSILLKIVENGKEANK